MEKSTLQRNVWEFTDANGDMSYISMTVTLECNYNCIMCYAGGNCRKSIPFNLFKQAIDSAKTSGLKKIELTGGEALLHKDIWEMLEYLHDNDVETLLVSNGSLITENVAKRLKDLNVHVAVSLHSINKNDMEAITNVKGSYERTISGINELLKIGYSDSGLILAVRCMTMVQNAEYLYDTWKWAKENHILFILNRTMECDRCQKEWIMSKEDLHTLLEKIAADEGQEAILPFSDNSPCNRFEVGCHIGVDGKVYPCACIDEVAGDINEHDLSYIWNNSELLQKSKNVRKHIHGPCKECEHSAECFGCRAVAYGTLNDMFASDPYCWRYSESH